MEEKYEKRCIICINNIDVKYCRDCYKCVCYSCVDSEKCISFVLKKHNKCLECDEEICCYKLICYKCDKYSYHMITDNVAVGSSSSDYKNFDVIIDLNYPENGAPDNDIIVQKKDDKLIISVGIPDSEYKEKEFKRYLNEIIPVLYKYYIDKRILFHCFSGVSRSAAFAIGYLFYTKNISIDEGFEIIKSKRKFINPNKVFMAALKNFESEILLAYP